MKKQTQKQSFIASYIGPALAALLFILSAPAARAADQPISIDLTGTGWRIFAGEERTYHLTLTNTDTVTHTAQQVDIKFTGEIVSATTGFPNVQQTASGGVTRLRHRYNLAADQALSLDFTIKAPGLAQKNHELLIRLGDGLEKKHTAVILQPIPETLDDPDYFERQIPYIFIDVFRRTPTASELAHWRAKLAITKKLGAIQGMMEVARDKTTTATKSAVPIAQINSLFREVYGRNPTVSEWTYWAGRRLDKPSTGAFTDALKYHRDNNIQH